MSELQDQMTAHIMGLGAAPFLFVGSGMSRRYLNLPDWTGLLSSYAKRVGKDYHRFLGEANGDLPGTASLIAEAFYDLWWEDPEYASQVERYRKTITGKDRPLKIAISEDMVQASECLDIDNGVFADELRALRDAPIDGIITTNWDLLLDKIFTSFTPYIGQEDLMFDKAYGVAELYKIHGSCTKPESLVLTSADYRTFERRNPYLSARLLSIFVEHPVIFLGYRLGDPNIQAILESIVNSLDQHHLEQLQDRLIFVQRSEDNDPSLERRDQTFGNLRLPILVARTNNFTPIYQSLGPIKRKFSAKILRTLRESVYELVESEDPKGRIYVEDIDNATNPSEVDVVLGVGLIAKLGQLGHLGYRPLTRNELLKDVLADTSNYVADKVVADVLPRIAQNRNQVPCFRYLAAAGYKWSGESWNKPIDAKLAKWISSTYNRLQPDSRGYATYRRQAITIAEKEGSFAGVREIPFAKSLYILRFMPRSTLYVWIDDLRNFLLENIDAVIAGQPPSNFAAVVGLYDLLVYGGSVGFFP